ncbi:MAG: glutathione S-transferase C-terminal domain-containing protein [Myxococcota bacterium]
MTEPAYIIVGAVGSPYSRKLRAVMQYRRIPYRWVHQGWPESQELPKPPVQLLPRLVTTQADGSRAARIDTTPLIRDLERESVGRSVIPPDPVVAFLDFLLEDYADEWLTKAMFHYRWAHGPDIAKAAAILPRWYATNRPEHEARSMGEVFSKRQIDRLSVVGSNETTAPVIERSYVRLLRLLDTHLGESRFLMGGRPGASDFGVFGQLTQLAGFDPTSAAVALSTAPRVVAWIDVVEDLSGLETREEDWINRDAIPETLKALLAEVGRVYAPFLLANAAALERGAARVEGRIDGKPWVQKPFPYQGKCLAWLREAHAGLTADDRGAVDAVLAGTGCEALFCR